MMPRCLDRKEVQFTTWQMHTTRPVLPVETQDGFFSGLAGLIVPNCKAIVHWVLTYKNLNYLQIS